MARTALVTGGGRGIGRAIAAGLATDGFQVVIVDLRQAEAEETVSAIEEGGGVALAVEADVADSASVEAAVRAAEERFGHVDVLVNCAGWDDLMPFMATDEAFWDRVIDINFKGPLRFTRLLLPGMTQRGYGRIVNIGSDAGRVGSSMESVYSGAKGGLIAFTKTIAREVARKGVTANVVCPGPTDTPMLQETMAAADDADAVLKAMVRAVPMKRLGAPEDIAAAVCFFAGESAGYVTGQTLSVSGGLTMA
ncbi:MAG TPA: SDR family NAD(P)-dependent oxidoreductase [Baekduia sp.]|uniref:SDR family NAD(P)-dependent oxidoreductase n=1 Tax=Baekduia sp. TaxID=2600305 RepID=UPI002D77EFFC|nr:SDR family NAD(P)-dependent oxidoreductase [Baekduia sp.]HET6507898.1 SDR family NAD(P)-dependent oxidoreductase [Baekduia sp.]